jgi:hypothetical protein
MVVCSVKCAPGVTIARCGKVTKRWRRCWSGPPVGRDASNGIGTAHASRENPETIDTRPPGCYRVGMTRPPRYTPRAQRRMHAAILLFLSKNRGRWGARAIAELLCADVGGPYGGRNPFRLLSTVHAALVRLTETAFVERRDDVSDAGRARFVYALTPKGRMEARQ